LNPILQEALGSIVRWLLTGAAGYLVSKGIWTQDNATTYVSAAAVAILALVWSLWQKYKSRSKLLVALASPTPMTEHQAEAKVSQSMAPSTSMPKDVVPPVLPAKV